MNNKIKWLLICMKIKNKMTKLHNNLTLFHKIKYHNNKIQEYSNIHQNKCHINKVINLNSFIIVQNHRNYQKLLHIQNKNLILRLFMKRTIVIKKIYIKEKTITNKINNK